MGAPAGHPFFGNQYTNGGYIANTFTYKVMGKGVDNLITVSNEIGKSAAQIATRENPEVLVSKELNPKGINKTALIAVGISLLAAVSGYFAYKYIKKKAEAKKDALQSIELSNVGTCTDCGEPLSGSTYVPESEVNGQKAHIICNNCGSQNFAWYPDENDSPNKDEEDCVE